MTDMIKLLPGLRLSTVPVCLLLIYSIGTVTASEEWEYFTFAQAWPPGTCVSGIFEHHTCHVPDEVQTWCIHGLWPSSYSKEINNCNSSLVFDFSQIAKLTKNLSTYWPNLYNDTEFDSFWEHEWKKHGTCCQDLAATHGELNYFSIGLMLQQKYNIERMLSNSGIVPSDTEQYSYDDFINAIKRATGFEPVIECTDMKLDNGTDFHLIDQIEICLTKDFQPTSCYDDPGKTRGEYSASNDLEEEELIVEKDSETLFYEKKVLNLGRHHHHHHHHHWHHNRREEPQSNCPRKYKFNYPPIEHV